MTHGDAGKYRSKHSPGTEANEQIAKGIREQSPAGELACAVAEKISGKLGVTMSEVGITADLLEMKIKKCQLGLFGWGKQPGHGKDIRAAESVSAEVKDAIQAVAKDGAVTCAALWVIADQLGAERKAVSSSCEALGLKIRPCQLGAF